VIVATTVQRGLTVLNPLGFPPRVKGRGLAPSLDSLDGKKLFLVDVGFENSDRFMEQLADWLARHEPGIRTEIVRWRDQHKPDPELCTKIQAEGDAAILGVGL
jgi:hypothetical protein